MTKEVLLSIKGLQVEAGEDSREIETIAPAEYYNKNGTHYIFYEEEEEGTKGIIRNRIKFRENYLEVTKKGTLNVHMIFEEKKKNNTTYATPYGEMTVGVDTESIKLTNEEERILIHVEYALDINYVHMADCTISVDVRSRENCG